MSVRQIQGIFLSCHVLYVMQRIDIGEYLLGPAELSYGLFRDGKGIDLAQQVVDLEHISVQQALHHREDPLVVDGVERFSSLGPYRDDNIMISCA